MKKKTLLSSLLTIALCLVLIAGTTYALFTSEDKIDIAVSSANVKVNAAISNIVTSSMGVERGDKTFENGGSAAFDGEIFTLALMTPGDKVSFNLTVENASNVTTQYRYSFTCVNGDELMRALNITIGSTTYTELSAYTSNWQTLGANAEIDPLPVVIEMPETVGNRFQGLEAQILVFVEAVQGNAPVTGSETVTLLPDEWDGTASTAWYYTRSTEYVLNTAEDLAGLSQLVAEGVDFAGRTVKLARDLDLLNLDFAPIGSWDTPFKGNFDGQGYVIHNLYINTPTKEEVGLFGTAISATIQNVNINNVDILGDSQIGAIVGLPYTGCTVSNCHVTGDISIIAEYAYAGGIVGYGYVNVNNCSVIANGTGVIKAKERNAVGGIAAWLLEDVSSITNCTVKNLELTGWANIGGLTGFVHYNNVISGCTVENVVITKTRETGHPSVGIAAGGFSYNENKEITITNNTFKNISLNGTAVAKKSAGYIYGSEYGGADNSNFVLENNAEADIVNNIVYLASSYENLTEGKGKNGSHQLTSDIAVTDKIYFGENTTNTIDLNGQNVTTNTSYVFATQGANCVLTIGGEGTVTTSTGYAALANKNSTLIVDGGTYNLGSITQAAHFYTQNSATTIINDGTFISTDADTPIVYCINGFVEINGGFFQNTANPNAALLSMGNNLKYADNQKITISGGTFVNWNPMSSAFARPWTNPDVPALIVLAEGCEIVEQVQENGDIWYVVVNNNN